MTTSSPTFDSPIISAAQLNDLLDNPNLVIVDASMAKAAQATVVMSSIDGGVPVAAKSANGMHPS